MLRESKDYIRWAVAESNNAGNKGMVLRIIKNPVLI
jgi:hypothetical protein